MLSYYKDFKIKDITKPEYRHLFLISFWVFYLCGFVLTEKFVVPVYNMYCPLDDHIPFCEFFVIPYVLWYAMLAFVSLYTLFFDVASFKKFYSFLFISSFFAFSIYILFPNMQNLRPQEFVRDNVLVDVMKNLYTLDTNTNVCPSFHVVFSLGMLFTLWNSKHFKKALSRVLMAIFTALVCLATVFLKQHSIIDVFAGIALSALVFPFVFLKSKEKNIFLKKE